MSFNPSKISDDFSSAPQIAMEDMAQIAAQGFRAILNCRPDGEGGVDQPGSDQLREAAIHYGLEYYYLPVAMGSANSLQAAELAGILPSVPKPILGFCKSGMRASILYQAASNARNKPTLLQWLKSKCLITRLIRWMRKK